MSEQHTPSPTRRTRKPRTLKVDAKRSFVGLRLTPADRIRLEAAAARRGLTISEFVRSMVENEEVNQTAFARKTKGTTS